jgi:hypothetical protein
MSYETVWSFKTANFTVTYDIAPEDMDPRDELDPHSLADVLADRAAWFQARVAVRLPSGGIIGSSHLGGCCYDSTESFRTSHFETGVRHRNTLANKARGIRFMDYFPDMVREAVKEARTNGAIRLRAP